MDWLIDEKYDANRIYRILYYEEKLNRCADVLSRMDAILEEYESIQADIKELEHYYTGPSWMEDFEADEAGYFPKDLKRGVLSEDGIEYILDENTAVRSKINSLSI